MNLKGWDIQGSNEEDYVTWISQDEQFIMVCYKQREIAMITCNDGFIIVKANNAISYINYEDKVVTILSCDDEMGVKYYKDKKWII